MPKRKVSKALRMLIVTVIYTVLYFILTSCANTNTTDNNNVSSSPQPTVSITEDEAKAIITDLIPKAANFYRSVFNGGSSFQTNTSVTIPGFENYVLVDDDRIKSSADLKSWVEEVFTPEMAELIFFSRYMRDLDKPLSSFDPLDYTPLYYDYDGKLFVDSGNGGRGFAFDWDYSSIKITELKDDVIIADIDRYLFEEFDETSSIILVKRDAQWLIANDFVNKTDAS